MTAFETSLALDAGGISDADAVDTLRADLLRITAGAVTMDALSSAVGDTAFTRVAAGTVNFGWGLPGQSALPGGALMFGLPFAFDAPEMASWYYEGGGRTAQVAEMASAAIAVEPFMCGFRGPEAGGWFKEAITMDMMKTGKYSDGTQVQLRIFGVGRTIMNAVFPNVVTTDTPGGQSPLQAWIGGTYNALEFGQPEQDASPDNPASGLFPNWPAKGGSIIDTGASHYYISPWWQPTTTLELWVNKTFYDALSADNKLNVFLACQANALKNMAQGWDDQDDFIQQFKDMGVAVHEQWPHDVLSLLRAATPDALQAAATADGTGSYQAHLDSMKAHIAKNQVRWRAANGVRADRFKQGWEDGYLSDLTL